MEVKEKSQRRKNNKAITYRKSEDGQNKQR
jgi:hypothetical protein